jgi:hypothetical protein
MRSTYPGKSAKLDALLAEVVHFFESRGFTVSTKRTGSGAVASMKASKSTGKFLDVVLEGDANSALRVTFANTEGSPLSNSAFLSLMGGGFLTLRKLKTADRLESLEKDFWDMVDLYVTSS